MMTSRKHSGHSFQSFVFSQFVQNAIKNVLPILDVFFQTWSDLVISRVSIKTLERDWIRPRRNEVCYFNELIMVPCAPLVLCGPTRSYVVLCVYSLHFCIIARIIKNRNLTSSHLPFQSGNVFQ